MKQMGREGGRREGELTDPVPRHSPQVVLTPVKGKLAISLHWFYRVGLRIFYMDDSAAKVGLEVHGGP